jgi:hypothetical protein
MKVVEFAPGKKVCWLVLDSYFSFTRETTEWLGTKICFDISQKDNQTQITFTHQGLTKKYECYEVCRVAWQELIHLSLKELITTGKGRPNPRKGNGTSPVKQKRWELA